MTARVGKVHTSFRSDLRHWHRSDSTSPGRSLVHAELLERRVLLSDTVSLLKDINESPPPYPSYPTALFDLDGTVYFSSSTATANLYASDGSAAGTRLVKVINPRGQASPVAFAGANGVVYLVADDGVHGRELWRSDGTEAGTRLVKDVVPGPGGIVAPTTLNPIPGAMVDNTLYFIVPNFNSPSNNVLWKSDGTEQGTVPVIEGATEPLVGVGGNAYFVRADAATGAELWKTDGTAAGTSLVKDLRSGPGGSAPHNFVTANGQLYFIASGTDDTTQELYRTDGTPGGTVLLKSGVSYAFPIRNPAGPLADTVFFVPGPPSFEKEPFGGLDADLWKTDGTVAGTVKVKDFQSYPYRSPTQILSWYDGGIILKADSPTEGAGLWKSDGTEAGTVLLKQFPVDDIREAAAANGKVFFNATDNEHGTELYVTDGTPEGTGLYADYLPGNFSFPGQPTVPASSWPRSLHAAAHGVVFMAYSSYWNKFTGQTTDLFTSSAGLVYPRSGISRSSNPNDLVESGGAAYFTAFTGNATHLYRTDGTSAGTAEVPGVPEANILEIVGDLKGTLLFSATTLQGVTTLWRTDGAPGSTVKIADAPRPYRSAVVLGDTAYFIAQDPTDFHLTLWRSDGTVPGTQPVVNLPNWASDLYAAGGKIFFYANTPAEGLEPWVSDGTAAGTHLLKDVIPGTAGANFPTPMVDLNGQVYFTAYTAATGTQLWKSDGTTDGTVVVKSLGQDPTGESQTYNYWQEWPFVFNGRMYFTQQLSTGSRVFESDGTAAGTVPARFLEGTGLSALRGPFFSHGGYLYFNAVGPTGDFHNLYRTDGSPGNVSLVKTDLAVASYGAVDGRLFMTARPASSSVEEYGQYRLWTTDGTPAGTRQLADPVANSGLGPPRPMIALDNDRLVFPAVTPQYGDEPWVVVPDGAGAAPRTATVAGRHVFYDNSYHDSFHPGGDAKDDPAVATDKQALLPGQVASFANLTSYNRGLNGIMVDIAGLPAGATLSADDFIIRSGAAASPAALAAGPSVPTVTVRRGKGDGGSDRVTLCWPDGAIKNKWVQVTVKADNDTGLASPDVFYFGNLVGEIGDTLTPTKVSAADLAGIKRMLNASVGPGSPYDINRDGKVNALDLGIIRAGLFQQLAPIAVPLPVGAAASTGAGETATSLLRGA
jgi:ELWxxDGT repeat protein